MSGSTPNYHWTLPTIGGDASSWGSELNADLGLIDGQVKVNENAIAAINGQLTPSSLSVGTSAGGDATITFVNNDVGQPRWILYDDGAAETGGNVGSDLVLQCYSDVGAYLNRVFAINRVTQRMTLAQDPVASMEVATKHYVDTVGASAAPIGSIMLWGSTTPPSGWTWCNGAHYAAAALPALFNVIGGNFFWDGTNFGLPLCSGRVVIGYDGGGWSLGRQDGEYSHTLTSSELPTNAYADSGHTHGASQPAHSHTYQAADAGHAGLASGGSFAGSYTGTTATAQPAITVNAAAANIYGGGNGAHNNMQPSIVLAYIIRYA